MIVFLDILHIEQVVNIHQICFPESQSTKFGIKYLEGYYKTLCGSYNAIAFIYQMEDKVVGFISGGVNIQTLSRYFVLHSKNILFGTLLSNLIKNPINAVRKFWGYTKAYILPKRETFYSDKTAGLSSIAVLPAFRGKGIAEMLTNAFLEELERRKISACRLGVEAHNISARKFYEKMGFEQVNKEGTSYIYFFDDIYRSQFPISKTT